MPTADEMLAGTVEEQYILVDLNTRLLNIPKSITNVGVESDDDVLRLPFKMPRYFGEFDLSEFKVRVNYLNARKLGDLFEPDDVTVTEDGNITFTWLVSRFAAAYKGNVSFNVCLKKYDEADPTLVMKEFNTTIAILPVLEGLETAEAVAAAYADILEAWRVELFGIVEGHGDDIEAWKEEVRLVLEGQANTIQSWKDELFSIYDDIEKAVDEYIASLDTEAVTSVNGKKGAVELTHDDVGAAAAEHDHEYILADAVTAKPYSNGAAVGIEFGKDNASGVVYFDSNNVLKVRLTDGEGNTAEHELHSNLNNNVELYKVGDIYITTNSTSPASIFGGTWEQIKDRFLLAAGTSYSAGKTGGSATHTLTVDEMPSHYHDLAAKNSSGSTTLGLWDSYLTNNSYIDQVYESGQNVKAYTYGIKSAGGGKAHNNMPPYLTVYIWKRVA